MFVLQHIYTIMSFNTKKNAIRDNETDKSEPGKGIDTTQNHKSIFIYKHISKYN